MYIRIRAPNLCTDHSQTIEYGIVEVAPLELLPAVG